MLVPGLLAKPEMWHEHGTTDRHSRCLQRSRHRNAVSTDGRHAAEYGLVARGGRRICLRFLQRNGLRERQGTRHHETSYLNGDDLRRDPLEVRKATLARMLAKAAPGFRFNSVYRSGRSPDWLKMKNSDAPAMKREAEEDWSK